MVGIAIPQDAPAMTRRTLGSLVPHPAAIGRITGARSGITAPRLKLAGGGIAEAENLEENMFQPINFSGIPNADVNFITSPQLAIGQGPPRALNSQPKQQPNGIQEFNQTAGAVGSIAGAYNAAPAIWGNVGTLADADDIAAGATAGTTLGGSGIAGFLGSLGIVFNKGGSVPHRDDGGEINGLTNMLLRQESHETYHPGGFLNSAGPGRTDTINTNVPTGAYIVPADVVSGLGEGNSLAGSAVIDRIFSTAPHGVNFPRIGRGKGPPPQHIAQPEPPPRGEQPGQTVNTSFINEAGGYEKGGKTDKAPVLLAGGEHAIPPDAIIRKFGSLKKGHRILDEWIVMERQRIAKEMLKLPGPVGSKVKKS